MLHFVISCQLSNIIDFLPDVGFRAAVDEHITHVLLSVVADIYHGTENLQLSESHLKSIVNIFNEKRNYPPLSPDSKYSYIRIRRLLKKIKETSNTELAKDVMNLNLESRFGGVPSEHMS